jgi:hypothetical protein
VPLIVINIKGVDRKLNDDEVRNMIAWKQGLFYKLTIPPYDKILTTSDKIPGVPYHDGLKSAYESFIYKGKKFPNNISFDMGAVDINIRTVKSKPKLSFNKDKQYNKRKGGLMLTRNVKRKNEGFSNL